MFQSPTSSNISTLSIALLSIAVCLIAVLTLSNSAVAQSSLPDLRTTGFEYYRSASKAFPDKDQILFAVRMINDSSVAIEEDFYVGYKTSSTPHYSGGQNATSLTSPMDAGAIRKAYVSGAYLIPKCDTLSTTVTVTGDTNGEIEESSEGNNSYSSSVSIEPIRGECDLSEPTIELSAAPLVVGEGDNVELTWSSENATTCTASGGWSGSKSTSGVESVRYHRYDYGGKTLFYTLECEGPGGDVSDTVTVNRHPVASFDNYPEFSSKYTEIVCGDTYSFEVMDNDIDRDGHSISLSRVDHTTYGDANIKGDVIEYRAPKNFEGKDEFDYRVVDTQGAESNWGDVDITVTCENEEGGNNAPTAQNDAYSNLQCGQTYTLSVMNNDSDSDGDSISISNADSTTSQGGSVQRTSSYLRYTAPQNLNGQDTFAYTIRDSEGATATARVTTAVSCGSTPPPPPADDISDSVFITVVDDGDISDSVTVQVGDAPSVNLTATPNRAPQGVPTDVVLRWDGDNIVRCSASGHWNGNKSVSGEETLRNERAPRQYTIECWNSTGNASATDTTSLALIPSDFSLSRSSVMELGPGQTRSTESTISVNSLFGFDGPVTLSLQNISPALPGATLQLSDPVLDATEYEDGTQVWVTVDGEQNAGTYEVTIEGRSGGRSRTVIVNLNAKGKNPSYEEF